MQLFSQVAGTPQIQNISLVFVRQFFAVHRAEAREACDGRVSHLFANLPKRIKLRICIEKFRAEKLFEENDDSD